eukprot:TRINITY_DN6511_c0_g2_i9.p1 TRINITY_DN6511_c0_g2~~TRINITY_DN6511_c0_g2_i9.p1  ORF type:complete len:121 (+),score=30.66 TRINITY_DN6511_c0_g2_i9:131-493(+)
MSQLFDGLDVSPQEDSNTPNPSLEVTKEEISLGSDDDDEDESTPPTVFDVEIHETSCFWNTGEDGSYDTVGCCAWCLGFCNANYEENAETPTGGRCFWCGQGPCILPRWLGALLVFLCPQ